MRAIQKGSTIGIVSISSPLNPEAFDKGVRELERLGFISVWPFDPTNNYGIYTHGFSCASPEQRAQGLMSLIDDPKVDAIILARGGYGANQVLDLLDYQKISEARKLIVGFSDMTLLLCAVSKLSKIPTVHGATISRFFDLQSSNERLKSVEALIQLLSNSHYRISIEGEVLRPGQAQGRLIVGNLTMLTSLIGTPWDPDYTDAILVLEDTKEFPYRVHRALTHLNQAGKFNTLAALCFGQFTAPELRHGPTVTDIIDGSIKDILVGTDFPVLKNLSVGHLDFNLPLPLMCKAQIVDNKLETLESPLSLNVEVKN